MNINAKMGHKLSFISAQEKTNSVQKGLILHRAFMISKTVPRGGKVIIQLILPKTIQHLVNNTSSGHHRQHLCRMEHKDVSGGRQLIMGPIMAEPQRLGLGGSLGRVGVTGSTADFQLSGLGSDPPYTLLGVSHLHAAMLSKDHILKHINH